MNVPQVTRQLLPRAERRAAILKAAATAFAHKGFAATSMDDVAAEAGITKLIVYRHFASKEELYEAVLERVSKRLAEEFVAGLDQHPPRGVGVRTLLTVAREDPDGFVLLWRHAAREPQFAEHAERFRQQAVKVAVAMLSQRALGGDRRRKRWAAEALMSWLVDAVVHWLEEGTADRDDELIELVSRSLPAMITAWSEVD
ncbi:MAG TPA: TetR/AcrR family transcriptional regulator [Acidimicrobiales bacterium]|nr:TetR/AcrR family transcriptional regulator [Acidimicrobiales bacterium]